MGHEFGESLAADADLHDIQAPLDALAQSIDEIADVAPWHDFEYMHFGGRCAADYFGRCGRRGGDDACAVSALSQFVGFPALWVLVAREINAPYDMTKQRVSAVAA